MAALSCARCGQVIVNKGRQSQGKTYCASCYDAIIKEQEALAVDKQSLCDYIKKVFGLAEIPGETMFTIDKLVREGKKLKGIRATLYYYFEILGRDGVSVILFSKIVNEYYESARAYLKKTKEITAKNADIDIDGGTMTYKISDKNVGRRKPKKKIEDL